MNDSAFGGVRLPWTVAARVPGNPHWVAGKSSPEEFHRIFVVSFPSGMMSQQEGSL